MHVVVLKRELARILARCQGVADKRSTMPVLGNVLLESSGPEALRLAATDLYLGVSATIPAKVEVEGSAAVGARDLLDRVKMMPEGQLVLTTQGDGALTLKAVGQARRYTLKGLPGTEFPALPQPSAEAPTWSLSTDALSLLIHHTHFSIAADDTRLHLNSALFQWEDKLVRMVTTDGHRLSKMEVTTTGDSAEASMLIPLKGIQELRRLCEEAKADAQDDVEITQTGPNAFFKVGALRLSMKLVDVQFPPYEQVIPASCQHSIKADRVMVSHALRAVSVAASERTGGVKITFGGNVMRFASESPDSGEGFDEVPIEYAGDDLVVGFNAHYLLQVLGSIEEEQVVLGISGELDPATIRPAASEQSNSNYLAVVMPMRI